MTIPAVRRAQTAPHILAVELPAECVQPVQEMGEWLQIRVSRPRRPRTTGWKSQNHHINGHCQQISTATGNSFSAVKQRMKELAIDRGYPMETLPDGSAAPKSEGDIDTVEAGLLIDTIHQFAAEWDVPLEEEAE